MGKRLLIIGAGIEQIRAYQLAREMGLQTVGSDMNPDAPAFEYSDDCILASTRNPEETLRAVKKYATGKRIDGVMTIANDVPLTVAIVANALALPSISIDSARVAANKMLMKTKFLECNVPTPTFWLVKSYPELQAIAAEQGYPLVIKPVDGRGARGVFRLTEDAASEELFNASAAYSESGTLLLERFIEGPQLSTESILYKGKLYTATYTHRNYEYLERLKPLIIENGGDQPADVTEDQKKAVDDLIILAAHAMGIDQGIVKGDIVLNDGSPLIIELAARLSGGYFCTDQIPLATGVDLVKQVIKLALNESLDAAELIPLKKQAVAIRYWFPPPGLVKRITGVESVAALPGVYRLQLFRKVGEIQSPITDHTKRAGFVITYGETRGEAITRAHAAIDAVKFHVDSSAGLN